MNTYNDTPKHTQCQVTPLFDVFKIQTFLLQKYKVRTSIIILEVPLHSLHL